MAQNASAGEWWNPLDPDNGFSLNQIPLIGGLFDGVCEENSNSKNENKVNGSWILGIGGTVGGALLGSYLGKDFGTIGKIGGGILGAFVAPKLVKGIALDAACASDYVEEGKKQGKQRDWLSAFGSNLTNLSGQSYNGHTVDVDPDVDV